VIRIRIWKWTQLVYYFVVVVLAVLIIVLTVRYLSRTASDAAWQQTAEMQAGFSQMAENPEPAAAQMGFSLLKTDAGDAVVRALRRFFHWWEGSASTGLLAYACPALMGESRAQAEPITLVPPAKTETAEYVPPDAEAREMIVAAQSMKAIEDAQRSEIPLPIRIMPEEPRILFYSTHSRESYRKEAGQEYTEVSAQRTDDVRYNVLGVGAELKRILQSEYQITSIADMTNHEPPEHGTAYSRSLQTVSEIVKAQPGLEMIVDVHRDAYIEGMARALEYEGVSYARIAFVVGTGKGKTGAGFSVMPDWESNLALAQQLTDRLNSMIPGLCKEPILREGRYNQHVSDHSLLVEIGHNENTLDEVQASLPYLARAIAETLGASTQT